MTLQVLGKAGKGGRLAGKNEEEKEVGDWKRKLTTSFWNFATSATVDAYAHRQGVCLIIKGPVATNPANKADLFGLVLF